MNAKRTLPELLTGQSAVIETAHPEHIRPYWEKKLKRRFSIERLDECHARVTRLPDDYPRAERGAPRKYPFRDLAVGQSFIETDRSKLFSLRSAASRYAKSLGRHFVVARISKGIGVRRVA